MARGLREVVGRNRRRYGGYVVHLGIVLIFLGFSGAAFEKSWVGELKPGDSFTLGPYDVRYQSSRIYATPEKMVNMAVMEVRTEGKRVATLRPQRNFHFAQRQPQSEIGLRTTLSEDLYLVLTQMDRSRTVTLRAWINPLVVWIWIGGTVMAAGMLIILSAKPPQMPPPPSAATAARRPRPSAAGRHPAEVMAR